jgi:hypothetical protein
MRSVLLVVTIVAILLGWMVDRRLLKRQIEDISIREAKYARQSYYEQMENGRLRLELDQLHQENSAATH